MQPQAVDGSVTSKLDRVRGAAPDRLAEPGLGRGRAVGPVAAHRSERPPAPAPVPPRVRSSIRACAGPAHSTPTSSKRPGVATTPDVPSSDPTQRLNSRAAARALPPGSRRVQAPTRHPPRPRRRAASAASDADPARRSSQPPGGRHSKPAGGGSGRDALDLDMRIGEHRDRREATERNLRGDDQLPVARADGRVDGRRHAEQRRCAPQRQPPVRGGTGTTDSRIGTDRRRSASVTVAVPTSSSPRFRSVALRTVSRPELNSCAEASSEPTSRSGSAGCERARSRLVPPHPHDDAIGVIPEQLDCWKRVNLDRDHVTGPVEPVSQLLRRDSGEHELRDDERHQHDADRGEGDDPAHRRQRYGQTAGAPSREAPRGTSDLWPLSYAALTGAAGCGALAAGGGVYSNSSSAPNSVSSTLERSFSLSASARPAPIARISSLRPSRRRFFLARFFGASVSAAARVAQRLRRVAQIGLKLLVLEQRLRRRLAVASGVRKRSWSSRPPCGRCPAARRPRSGARCTASPWRWSPAPRR